MNTPAHINVTADAVVEAAPSRPSGDGTAAQPKPLPSVIPDVPTAQRWHGEAMLRYRQAVDRQRVATGRRNLALRDWQVATAQTITPEQLIRQHINAETQMRHDVKAGLVSPYKTPDQPGPSAIDEFAFATRKQGRRPGGGGSFRRGGQDKNAEARRQAIELFRAKQIAGA